MVLPEYPHFREIDLNLRSVVQAHLIEHPLEASEYTFTNLFAYRDLYGFKLSLFKNNLIILKDVEPVSVFCPSGNRDILNVIGEVFNYLND